VNFPSESRERDEFIAFAGRITAEGAPLAHFFSPETPIGVARAPGRLDVMGGIADYSGSLVLEMPIAYAAFAAAQLHPEPGVRVASVDPARPERLREVRCSLSELLDGGYAGARRLFESRADQHWAAYVAGVILPLVLEEGLSRPTGVRILVTSSVPEGKGVSSSAALEVAALFALARAAELPLAPTKAALLCQKVENVVVGAPCGVMDQMTAACGERGRLLQILCQPATILGTVSVPPELAVFGIDSGVRHAVTGADYRQVRVAAFMGYSLLAEAFGFDISAPDAGGVVRVDDSRYFGYLANISPSELGPELRARLPERLSGAEFLATHAGTSDPVTRVEPASSYPVRAATLHPIEEHHRVRAFAELLSVTPSSRVRVLLGELMYQSHASYGACGLGSLNTDRLVQLARKCGPESGIYGAKITGGGSGGTVAILGGADAEPCVREIAARYAAESGIEARVFVGSSAGAAALGTIAATPVSIAGSKLVT
jgi:L-arabinokinase